MMNRDFGQSALPQIPLIEEKYGRPFLASIAFHGLLILLIVFGGYLLPQTTVQIGGSGPGGGTDGDISTVGVVSDLSGGAGMTKPSLIPQPPALPKAPAADSSKAIPLPGTLEQRKKKPEPKQIAKAKTEPKSNIIPTAPEPGSGGMAGNSGGSGGGSGGGIGVSLGPGSGGFGNSWYAQRVEDRISSNWTRPAEGVRVDMTYSFFIAADGTIYGIELEKSSGNPQMDLIAKSAILSSSPLSPPPAEFRGRPVQFIARFVYPRNP